MGWFLDNAYGLQQQAATPPTNGWGGQAQKLLDQQQANPTDPFGGSTGMGATLGRNLLPNPTQGGYQMPPNIPGIGYQGDMSQIGKGGTPPGYHYEGIDWDQHLVPDDPNNPNTPPSMKLPRPGAGGEVTLPPGFTKSPGMPAMGEGPGGWTGHAQDPNFGQLGQLPSGNGNLLGPNPIQGGNPQSSDNVIGRGFGGGYQSPSGGGMVQLRAPTGEVKAVPLAHVSRLMGLGATRVS